MNIVMRIQAYVRRNNGLGALASRRWGTVLLLFGAFFVFVAGVSGLLAYRVMRRPSVPQEYGARARIEENAITVRRQLLDAVLGHMEERARLYERAAGRMPDVSDPSR